ncbi:Gfo/Idh/MocA family protein [Jeotgalibacillus haloalkalitolerans]|uniref:Gfo/Idh/MocA family oxidoreductase n=1 Tax=Jeotgalibacillus haloalkalitolerans TaxID=3104292 RepID=A0ABU5KIJ5_9BACL|nr:Gfo/Idh/MocA family oxidoreductase [Jeotgalibacillus sp. HH7-29]MDZ5711067.1 Gfo/Idh/MocA family oxidoreductase [Jeotgalibacillus sp. HH7-29]
MAKLKVGVVGAGSIAKHRHLAEYAANKNVEIVAICDINEKRAKEMAKKFGAAQTFTDYKDLVKLDLDAVSVCTPNHLHAPVSIAALEAGKHVLCEKPMATSEQEADDMIAAAEKAGKLLMIGHNQRFVASHQKAQEWIASGELGKVYSFRTAFGHPGPEGWSADGKDSWFFKKDEAFIGAMGDLGVHKTDLIRYILGEEMTEVAAMVETSAKENTDVDDNAVLVLKTESGIIGTLAASWSYVAEDNATVIYAEKGVLRLEDDPEYSVVLQKADGTKEELSLGKIQSNDEGGQVSTGVIDHFVDSILSGKQPLIDGEEGKRSLKVILGALESNKSKQIVKL